MKIYLDTRDLINIFERAHPLKANFRKMIERKLNRNGLSYLQLSISAFTDWIYEKPIRCPSVRILYEVWHKIVRNKTDKLQDSDMEDFQHLSFVPYINLISLDKRMCGYVEQAGAPLRLDYAERIVRSVQDMLSRLDSIQPPFKPGRRFDFLTSNIIKRCLDA